MLNEVNSVGYEYTLNVDFSSAASLAQAGVGASAATLPKQSAELSNTGIESTIKRTFSALSSIKDDASQTAVSIRQAGQALDHADGLLNEMEAKVSLVKNYPPFPPGNEDRVKYLNSIDGLRKELQAITVPAAADTYKPVFYPKESSFPQLDAKIPSDAAVLAFGDAVKVVREKINIGREALQVQASQLSPGVSLDLPESQAQIVSTTAAAQLSGTSQPLVSSSDSLSQLAN